MTTATTTNEDPDEDVVTMEMEPERRRRPIFNSARARIAFMILAGLAVLALLLAVFAIVRAPKNAFGLLVTALVSLAVIIIVEVVILLMAKPE